MIPRFSGWLSNFKVSNLAHAHYTIHSGPYSARFKLGLAEAMPKAYATDLRWRVVWLYITQYLDVHEISKQLCLSERTARRYIHLFEQTGDIKPVSQRHGPPRLLGEFEHVRYLCARAQNLWTTNRKTSVQRFARILQNLNRKPKYAHAC